MATTKVSIMIGQGSHVDSNNPVAIEVRDSDIKNGGTTTGVHHGLKEGHSNRHDKHPSQATALLAMEDTIHLLYSGLCNSKLDLAQPFLHHALLGPSGGNSVYHHKNQHHNVDSSCSDKCEARETLLPVVSLPHTPATRVTKLDELARELRSVEDRLGDEKVGVKLRLVALDDNNDGDDDDDGDEWHVKLGVEVKLSAKHGTYNSQIITPSTQRSKKGSEKSKGSDIKLSAVTSSSTSAKKTKLHKNKNKNDETTAKKTNKNHEQHSKATSKISPLDAARVQWRAVDFLRWWAGELQHTTGRCPHACRDSTMVSSLSLDEALDRYVGLEIRGMVDRFVVNDGISSPSDSVARPMVVETMSQSGAAPDTDAPLGYHVDGGDDDLATWGMGTNHNSRAKKNDVWASHVDINEAKNHAGSQISDDDSRSGDRVILTPPSTIVGTTDTSTGSTAGCDYDADSFSSSNAYDQRGYLHYNKDNNKSRRPRPSLTLQATQATLTPKRTRRLPTEEDEHYTSEIDSSYQSKHHKASSSPKVSSTSENHLSWAQQLAEDPAELGRQRAAAKALDEEPESDDWGRGDDVDDWGISAEAASHVEFPAIDHGNDGVYNTEENGGWARNSPSTCASHGWRDTRPESCGDSTHTDLDESPKDIKDIDPEVQAMPATSNEVSGWVVGSSPPGWGTGMYSIPPSSSGGFWGEPSEEGQLPSQELNQSPRSKNTNETWGRWGAGKPQGIGKASTSKEEPQPGTWNYIAPEEDSSGENRSDNQEYSGDNDTAEARRGHTDRSDVWGSNPGWGNPSTLMTSDYEGWTSSWTKPANDIKSNNHFSAAGQNYVGSPRISINDWTVAQSHASPVIRNSHTGINNGHRSTVNDITKLSTSTKRRKPSSVLCPAYTGPMTAIPGNLSHWSWAPNPPNYNKPSRHAADGNKKVTTEGGKVKGKDEYKGKGKSKMDSWRDAGAEAERRDWWASGRLDADADSNKKTREMKGKVIFIDENDDDDGLGGLSDVGEPVDDDERKRLHFDEVNVILRDILAHKEKMARLRGREGKVSPGWGGMGMNKKNVCEGAAAQATTTAKGW